MTSRMRREIGEIPEAAARLLDREAGSIAAAAAGISRTDPPFLVSVARGSSDHACTYLKYASELLLGLPVASVGPSVASIYDAQLRVRGSVSLSVYQSGGSPDIIDMTRALKTGGALAIVLTNTPSSPLAATADHEMDMSAGEERSVAATKTFVNSTLAGLWLLAELAEDATLFAAIMALPEALRAATEADWSPLAADLSPGSLYTIVRGPAWAISNKAALKFKEVCRLHCEGFSSAEILHGPVSQVGHGFPILAFAAADEAEAGIAKVADALVYKGATVLATTPMVKEAIPLPAIRTGHGRTDPLALIVSFYAMIEKVAIGLGLDPDAPRHLNKVTRTT